MYYRQNRQLQNHKAANATGIRVAAAGRPSGAAAADGVTATGGDGAASLGQVLTACPRSTPIVQHLIDDFFAFLFIGEVVQVLLENFDMLAISIDADQDAFRLLNWHDGQPWRKVKAPGIILSRYV